MIIIDADECDSYENLIDQIRDAAESEDYFILRIGKEDYICTKRQEDEV